MYYVQVQGQLLILDMNFCDFFIRTPLVDTNVANTLLVRFQGDADFISGMIKKLNDNSSPFYFLKLLQKEMMRVLITNKKMTAYATGHALSQ